MKRRPPRSTRTDALFPYTTLFRSAGGRAAVAVIAAGALHCRLVPFDPVLDRLFRREQPMLDRRGDRAADLAPCDALVRAAVGALSPPDLPRPADRKSTRLNSSH